MKILDCTLRDGGYINNWRFNEKFISEYCNVLNITNIDYVEIGFINKTNNYKNKIVGECRNLSKEYINKYDKYNFKKVAMADFTDINYQLLEEKINIDLIRIAFHKKDLKEALETCKLIKKLGYNVSVNSMAITNYSINELEYLFEFINNHNLDMLYIADSFGSLTQNDIKRYFDLFDSKLNKECAIGFHLHNNMNNAYGNYEFLKNYVNDTTRKIIVDTTMFGMGRGAGNLQTELVLKDSINIENIYKIVEFIQEFIKPIYKVNENAWSYDLDYLLSGYLKMHPNYIVKMRDLNISMKNRFFLIKKLEEKKYDYKYFSIDTINTLIDQYKKLLL
tara:strand:- start:674 stop:1678 length:1005 start_codon:yes stop_codon:yes gene_type:complete